MERYNSSLEHLLDELRRIDILLRCQVLRFRMLDQGGTEELRGSILRRRSMRC